MDELKNSFLTNPHDERVLKQLYQLLQNPIYVNQLRSPDKTTFFLHELVDFLSSEIVTSTNSRQSFLLDFFLLLLDSITHSVYNSTEFCQTKNCELSSSGWSMGYPTEKVANLLQWLVQKIIKYSAQQELNRKKMAATATKWKKDRKVSSMMMLGLEDGVQDSDEEEERDEEAQMLEQEEIVYHKSLQVLAACLFANYGVQIFVREVKEVKEFYRCLIVQLHHELIGKEELKKAERGIYVMSILARLVLNEPLGQKVFHQQNLEQTYNLIFSILRRPTHSMSTGTSIKRLQIACIDLLSDFGSEASCGKSNDLRRSSNAYNSSLSSSMMIEHESLTHLVQTMLSNLDATPSIDDRFANTWERKDRDSSQDQIEISIYFLTALLKLSHRLRRSIFKVIVGNNEQIQGDKVVQSNISLLWPLLFHKNLITRIKSLQLFLQLIEEDDKDSYAMSVTIIEALQKNKSNSKDERSVLGLLCEGITKLTDWIGNHGDIISWLPKEEYLYSTLICNFLAILYRNYIFKADIDSSMPGAGIDGLINSIGIAYRQHIDFQKCAKIIRLEGLMIMNIPMEDIQLNSVIPELSIHLLILMVNLVDDYDDVFPKGQSDSLDVEKYDDLMRYINRLIQSSSIAAIFGAGLYQTKQKDLVEEILVFIQKYLSHRLNARFGTISLTDGIVAFAQRLSDASITLTNRLQSSEVSRRHICTQLTTLQKKSSETINQMTAESNISRKKNQEVVSQLQNSLKEQEAKMQQATKNFDNQLKTKQQHCDHLSTLLDQKLHAADKKDQLLDETRAEKTALEQENSELKKKLQVAEGRLEDVAKAHLTTTNEIALREKEMNAMQKDLDLMADDYASQEQRLATFQDKVKYLESCLNSRVKECEARYEELILLSKAYHKQEKEMNILLLDKEGHINLTEKNQLEISELTKTIQKQKQTIGSQESKIVQLGSNIFNMEKALDETKNKEVVVSRHLNEVNRRNKRLESELADQELKSIEKNILLEKKQKEIDAKELELNSMRKEVGKQAKLQALIHQLSGGDSNDDAACIASNT